MIFCLLALSFIIIIVDGLGKNYANLQAVVKICQLFISELSTVIDSTNQILIPGAGIMERRHQWNVYNLPCALPPHQTALGSSRSPQTALKLHSAISNGSLFAGYYLTITDVTLNLQIIDFQFLSCCTSQPKKT